MGHVLAFCSCESKNKKILQINVLDDIFKSAPPPDRLVEICTHAYEGSCILGLTTKYVWYRGGF